MPAPALGILTYNYVWSIQTRDSNGVSSDADSAPTYSIFEEETTTAVTTGTMAKLGSNTGMYTESVDLETASGFESLKSYQLKIDWTVGGRDFSELHSFTIVGEASLAETGGGDYPVALSDMKLWLRIESAITDDDVLITTLISAATTFAQEYQHRSYITQTRTFYYDAFPLFFHVWYPPLISVTSIVYIDTNGDDQTLDSGQYRVDTGNEPGRITEAFNATWPSTRDVTNAVILTVSEGYGAAADVPDTIKAAIKLLVAHWYENREEVVVGATATTVPGTVTRLLNLERLDTL